MAILTMGNLEAPYLYVESENVVREADRLMEIGNTAVTLQEPSPVASLMSLQGLGKHLWKDIEPREYVNSLRNEWKS